MTGQTAGNAFIFAVRLSVQLVPYRVLLSWDRNGLWLLFLKLPAIYIINSHAFCLSSRFPCLSQLPAGLKGRKSAKIFDAGWDIRLWGKARLACPRRYAFFLSVTPVLSCSIWIFFKGETGVLWQGTLG